MLILRHFKIYHGTKIHVPWYLHGPRCFQQLQCLKTHGSTFWFIVFAVVLVHFHANISVQISCSTLPSEYGSEILNWLARKTSPLWLIVISVRGFSSTIRLTDWIQEPSRFCRHNKAKQNQRVRTSHTSTHNISSYRTTASNTKDECLHRDTNLSVHLIQFWLIQ